MALLTWGSSGSKRFLAGVDQCVLYQADNSNLGVAWAGITSILEAMDGEQITPFYLDGVKYHDRIAFGDFSASLTAYTFPDEFMKYDGVGETATGVFVDGQPQGLFHLSYRTTIFDDATGEIGYRYHIVYNLTAEPDGRTYNTVGADLTPTDLGWTLHSIPSDGNNDVMDVRSTAHMFVDTTLMIPQMRASLEEILYGSATKNAQLLSLADMITWAYTWNRIIVVDFGDGTWRAYVPDNKMTLPGDGTFEIRDINASQPAADTWRFQDTELPIT